MVGLPRLFVASLGFHENFALRVLASRNAGAGDVLLLVTVRPPARAVETAYGSASTLAGRLGVRVEPLEAVDPSALPAEAARLAGRIDSLAEESGAEEVVFEASGGSRILAALLLLTAMALAPKWRVEYLVQSDTGGDWTVRLGPSELRILSGAERLTPEDTRILEAILARPGIHQDELATVLGMHPKTLANRLSRLSRLGLAARRGRPRSLVPGPWTAFLVLKTRLQEGRA